MRLAPHLVFPGTCEEAFQFYARVLGGRVSLHRYGSSPGAETMTPEWRTKIVHGTLSLGDRELLGADVSPEEYTKPAGFFLLIPVAELTDARRIFDALAEGGAIKMPLQKTFWSPAFGVVVDRFAVPWEIHVEEKAT